MSIKVIFIIEGGLVQVENHVFCFGQEQFYCCPPKPEHQKANIVIGYSKAADILLTSHDLFKLCKTV